VRRVEAGLFLPDVGGFLVGRDVALVILEAGRVEFVLGQSPDFGQQLPRPGNGFFLVVIAERPVAEHLEKGVVGVVAAHVVEVVVLAGHAHTLLRVGDAGVIALVGAEEDVLELHHARVGEEQGRIPARHQRHGGHKGVSVLDEEVDKGLANFVSGQFFGHGGSRMSVEWVDYTNSG
jgi:hypothetical protein